MLPSLPSLRHPQNQPMCTRPPASALALPLSALHTALAPISWLVRAGPCRARAACLLELTVILA